MRRITQILSAIIINSYLGINPSAGKTLYQGPLKKLCVPILNCYSCPLSWGSCPIGSMQQTLKIGRIPFFVVGFFASIGALVGRFPCGHLCPFGFLQELLYKIKTYKITILKPFRYLKYVVLALTVLIPIFFHQPFFCKYICPAGTLEASVPQLLMNTMLINSIGFFFTLKYFFLLLFIAMSVVSKRFLCVTLCPIGAIYGLFNKFSILQMKVNQSKCTKCGVCRDVCPMDISLYENETDFDCIRCFECSKSCPQGAIKVSSLFNKSVNDDDLNASGSDETLNEDSSV